MYQRLNLKKKINKQNRNGLIDAENILMDAKWEDGRGLGGQVQKAKGLRSTDWQSQNRHGDAQCTTGNTVSNILVLCMVTGGYEIYRDDHSVSYMSDHWGVHLKLIGYYMSTVFEKEKTI